MVKYNRIKRFNCIYCGTAFWSVDSNGCYRKTCTEDCRKKLNQQIYDQKREDTLSQSPFDSLCKPNKKIKVLREQDHKCKECGIGQEWNGKKLNFDLDHINGNTKDNRRSNLRCLCPNCHSQTPTYKTLNSSHKKRTDEELMEALKKEHSGYSVLTGLGMNPHGGNYRRLRRIIEKYNLNLDYKV